MNLAECRTDKATGQVTITRLVYVSLQLHANGARQRYRVALFNGILKHTPHFKYCSNATDKFVVLFFLSVGMFCWIVGRREHT